MIRNRNLFLVAGLILIATTARAAEPETFADFQKSIVPLLQQYCYDCHGNGKHKADLALDDFKTMADITKRRETWQLVMENVQKGDMPPEEAKAKPTQAQRDTITKWIQQQLFQVDPKNPDPGRVTIHRLNRAEYNNTIRDLVGVDFQPAEDFPSDDSGYGFDNIGDVLSLPPVLMEKYLAAASRVMDEAIVTQPLQSRTRHYNANLMEMGFNADGDRGDGWMPLGALEEDGVATAMPVAAGDYIVRVYAFVRSRGGGGAPAGGGARRGGRGAAGPASAPADAAANDAAVLVNAAADGAAPPATAPAVAGRGGGRRGGGGRGRGAAAPPAADAAAVAEAIDAAPPTGGSQGLKLSLMIDNSVVYDWTVTAQEAAPGTYEYRLGVPAGKHRFAVVNRRIRGGENELLMKNGRMGREQGGVVWVKWVEVEGPIAGATRHYPTSKLETKGDGKFLDSGTRLLDHEGQVATKFNVPKTGEYILRAQAYADQAGDDPARMTFNINGKTLQTFDVLAPGNLVPIQGQRVFSMELLKPMPYVYEIKTTLQAGEQQFSVAFINDYVNAEAENPNLRDRNLYIDYLQVVSLGEAQPLPPIPDNLKRYLPKEQPTAQNKVAMARQSIESFTSHAWRRPVQASEVDGLMNLFALADKNGDSFESALKLPMKAALVSPNFLFRGEVQPDPDNPKSIHPVDEYALASRLSYFLWSSMPDDELLGLAAKNQLRPNLEAQVRRMLASPKARALVDNFSGQWLQTRNLKFVAPDNEIYPDYDKSLGALMAIETQSFFEYVMRQDRSVIDFLNGDYTFINERLANFYGIQNVTGENFRQVSLKGTPRAGVLTQGSVLTITSNPTRTSPVKRGKWVLDNLLGTPPPPPPPDVPELKNDGKPETGSMRKQMEQHRENPSCASCHARMDPIGFGLEVFDGVGKFREKDGEFPIDSSGQLVTGENFAGAAELANILATKKRTDFLNCIAEKMLTYALGRGVEYYDRPAIDQIVQGMEKNDLKFSSLIMEVVKSVPFQMRRGDNVTTASAPTSAPSRN